LKLHLAYTQLKQTESGVSVYEYVLDLFSLCGLWDLGLWDLGECSADILPAVSVQNTATGEAESLTEKSSSLLHLTTGLKGGVRVDLGLLTGLEEVGVSALPLLFREGGAGEGRVGVRLPDALEVPRVEESDRRSTDRVKALGRDEPFAEEDDPFAEEDDPFAVVM
jgi:hypothetical protein